MQQNLLAANNTVSVTKTKISNIDKLIFLVCAVDILFLPYIRIASASLSMILLPVWYIFNLKKVNKSSEFKLFVILFFMLILSIGISSFTFPNSMFLKSNLANTTILLYGFLYYFFYRYYFEYNNRTQLKKLLVFYILFGFTLASIYLVNPSLYFQIRSFWTMNGNVIEVTDSLIIHRFTSTFSDPNNAAVAFVAVLTFLLLNKKTTFLQSLFLIGATTVILLATMSSTGFVLIALTMFFYTLWTFLSKNFAVKRSTLLYFAILLLLAPIPLFAIYKFLGSDVAQMSLERVTGNSADSRLDIWKDLLSRENIFKYFLYGMGGTLIVDGGIFKPHNGHLHLIYNYGMIAYVIFIYIFFRKRKNTSFHSYFFLVPFFLGFTMNVGIYEPRFITLLAFLLASYAAHQPSKGRKA